MSSDIQVRVVESKPYIGGSECNVKAKDTAGNLYCLQLVNPPPVGVLLTGLPRMRDLGNVEAITPDQSNIFLINQKYYYRDLANNNLITD